jgi:hypothetical protein
LLLTRDADDGVAVWNGTRARAEEIKAAITAFWAVERGLRLSDEKPLITHSDEGFDCWGSRMKGDQRGAAGRWCRVSRVPPKAIQRFREAVNTITRQTFTDAVAAWTALAGLIRGWGHDDA